jgi:hypothetical protein
MSRSTIIRRVITVLGLAGAFAVLAPAAAQAETIGWGGTLLPGQTYCFSRYADASVYQVRVEGTATKKGARFRFLRNGVVLQSTPVDTSPSFAAERRTSLGTYPGGGTYTICAANHYATNTLVNLHVLFNNEFI